MTGQQALIPEETYSEAFLAFWEVYPKCVAKPDAWKAWRQMRIDEQELGKVVQGDVEKRTRLHWWSSNRRLILNPATYLRQQRWTDEDWEKDLEHERGGASSPACAPPRPLTQEEIDYRAELDALTKWDRVANAWFWKYICKVGQVCGGFPEPLLHRMLEAKARIAKQLQLMWDDDGEAMLEDPVALDGFHKHAAASLERAMETLRKDYGEI